MVKALHVLKYCYNPLVVSHSANSEWIISDMS